MVKLTPKQERFANCVADGMSQADAYRAAFDVKPTTKPETIQANASRLMADSTVSARVAELREMLTQKALWSREESVQVLAEIARGGDDTARAGDRVSAVKELNAMHGWNKQTIEHTGANGTALFPQAIIICGPDENEKE